MRGAGPVLVTGSTGQLGSILIDRIGADAAAAGLDLRAAPQTRFHQDVRRPLPATDGIIHCAAQVAVEASLADPRDDASHNIDGTLSVLEHARRHDVRVLVVSSAAVYGQPQTTPLGEDHATRPTNPYGLSKLTAERYTALYHDLYGVETVVVRPFNMYSPRMDLANQYAGVVGRFIARVRDGLPPRIEGDGQQTRDMVDARDVADAVLHLFRSDGAVGGTFNIGTGVGTSINDVARSVLDAAGSDLVPERVAARVGDIRHSVADVTALAATGFRCDRRLAEGVDELWRAFTGS